MLKNKTPLIITLVCLLADLYLFGQDRTIKIGDQSYYLVYRNNRLSEISDSISKNDLKENCKYVFIWRKGELQIIFKKTDGYIVRDDYFYKYDKHYRICEMSNFYEYGNHRFESYIGRKYRGKDTIPYKCYGNFFSNKRYNEEEISDDCEGKFKWHDIVVFELKNRRRYYKKGTRVIEYLPISGTEDPSDTKSKLYKFNCKD